MAATARAVTGAIARSSHAGLGSGTGIGPYRMAPAPKGVPLDMRKMLASECDLLRLEGLRANLLR
jgi:hypothetical protein